MGARYINLDELRADHLAEAVRLQLPTSGQPDLTTEEMQSLVRKLGLT
jgi:hypothetical protein